MAEMLSRRALARSKVSAIKVQTRPLTTASSKSKEEQQHTGKTEGGGCGKRAAPIGVSLQQLRARKRGRRPTQTYVAPEHIRLLSKYVYSNDTQSEMLREMIEALYDALYRFVILVTGYLSEKDPEQYWTGRDIFAVSAGNYAAAAAASFSPPPSLIGVKRSAGSGDEEEKEILVPQQPSGPSPPPPPSRLQPTPTPQQPGIRRGSRGAKVLERMLRDGRVNRESLRAWRLLFGAEAGLIPAGAHPSFGRAPSLQTADGSSAWITITDAVQMTLISPVMISGISAAHNSVKFVSGKHYVPVSDLMTTPGSVQQKFAQLVASEITVQKRRNSNFSNNTQLKAAQLELRTLQWFFRTLCYNTNGFLHFCVQGENSSTTPRKKRGFHSAQPTAHNFFPYLTQVHKIPTSYY